MYCQMNKCYLGGATKYQFIYRYVGKIFRMITDYSIMQNLKIALSLIIVYK